VVDFTRRATDEFNDPGPLGGRTYETKIDTVASWSWNTNASAWVRNVTATATNDLLVRNVTIVVLGLDQVVTGDFVIVDGVDVLVDPRAAVGASVRISKKRVNI
jgi:hypothetical protein